MLLPYYLINHNFFHQVEIIFNESKKQNTLFFPSEKMHDLPKGSKNYNPDLPKFTTVDSFNLPEVFNWLKSNAQI